MTFSLSMLAGALFCTPVAAQQDDFVVIVNAANPISSLTRDEASHLFLKRSQSWRNGARVAPVDLPDDSAARAQFSEAVHGRSVAAIKSFWQQQIFSGRGVPPVEQPSDADVLEYVQENPNAIGYVSAATRLASGVKPVSIN